MATLHAWHAPAWVLVCMQQLAMLRRKLIPLCLLSCRPGLAAVQPARTLGIPVHRSRRRWRRRWWRRRSRGCSHWHLLQVQPAWALGFGVPGGGWRHCRRRRRRWRWQHRRMLQVQPAGALGIQVPQPWRSRHWWWCLLRRWWRLCRQPVPRRRRRRLWRWELRRRWWWLRRRQWWLWRRWQLWRWLWWRWRRRRRKGGMFQGAPDATRFSPACAVF